MLRAELCRKAAVVVGCGKAWSHLVEQLRLVRKATVSGSHVSSDPICQAQRADESMDAVGAETTLAAAGAKATLARHRSRC